MTSKRFRDLTSGDHLDFSYAPAEGLPFAGKPPLLTQKEFDDQTTVRAKVGYGVFDTSDNEHRQCGRTLLQVYNMASAGVFKLVHEEHHWETQDDLLDADNSGVRTKMLVFVVWQELAQTTEKDYWENIDDTLKY